MSEVQEFLRKQWEKAETERNATIAKEQFRKRTIQATGSIIGALIGGTVGFLCSIISLLVVVPILYIILFIMYIFMNRGTFNIMYNTLNNPEIVDPNIVFGLWMLFWIVGGIFWGAWEGSNTLLNWFKKSKESLTKKA